MLVSRLTFYDDWLALDIPIYLAYGTEDSTSDLCDIVLLFLLKKGKRICPLKGILAWNTIFFEVNAAGKTNYEKGHWMEVMIEFVTWIK